MKILRSIDEKTRRDGTKNEIRKEDSVVENLLIELEEK
jgi:hypothetical protein